MPNNYLDTLGPLLFAEPSEPCEPCEPLELSELSETLDVSRAEADILFFLRGGTLPAPPFATVSERLPAYADGVTRAELDAETADYLRHRRRLCVRLRALLDAVEADTGTGA